MKKIDLIEQINKDCLNKGHGRKKWWAENLGVHQQALSYWLNGHRRPNGANFETINKLLSILADEKQAFIWSDFLHQIYFNKLDLNSNVLKEIIIKIISAETIDSRTLAFLSLLVKNYDIDFEEQNNLLQNRLGWLLEISGKKPHFKPIRSKNMPLIKVPGSYIEKRTVAYLKSIQTETGRRWRVYDCNIKPIVGSYIDNFLPADKQISKSA